MDRRIPFGLLLFPEKENMDRPPPIEKVARRDESVPSIVPLPTKDRNGQAETSGKGSLDCQGDL
jgi:hypothetical protein